MEQTDEQARVFNDSYERVMHGPAKSEEFFASFYKLLVATSDDAAGRFRNTDMAAQVRMLQASVAILLAFFSAGRPDDYLVKLAERHSKRGADIPRRLYSVWLDCLIETVRRFDPKFDDDVKAAWRAVYSKGIEFMTSRYEGTPPGTSIASH